MDGKEKIYRHRGKFVQGRSVFVGRYRQRRRAVSTIECVLVAPMLLFLAMGMAEFGQYFYIKNAFEQAARDVARVSVMPGAVQADPTTTATRTLGFSKITFNSSWLTITDITSTPVVVTNVSTVAAGHALTFSISTTYDTIPIVYRPLFKMTGQGIKNGKPMTGMCTMVKE
jgi:Flp pilus assembly protein TadG